MLIAVEPLLEDIAVHADAAGRPDHAALYRRDAVWAADHAQVLLHAAD